MIMVKIFQIAFFVANFLLLIGVNFTVNNESKLSEVGNISTETLAEDSNETDVFDLDIDDFSPKKLFTATNFLCCETNTYFEKHSPFFVFFTVHIRAPPILIA